MRRFYFLVHGRRDFADVPRGLCADEAAARMVDTLCGRWGVRPRDLTFITHRSWVD